MPPNERPNGPSEPSSVTIQPTSSAEEDVAIGKSSTEAEGLPSTSDETGIEKVRISETALQAIVTRVVSEMYQGPIPDPESFAKYEQSLKGAGDRILTMAEKEQAARLAQIPRESRREYCGRLVGQISGLIVLVVAMTLAAAICIWADDPKAYLVAGAMVAPTLFSYVEKITNHFRKKN